MEESRKLIIREMRESDRALVTDMMRAFYTSDAVMTDGSEEIFSNDISECVSDSPFLNGYVFEDASGAVKGYAMTAHSYSTEFGCPCVWIEDIYLDEDFRGAGFASEFFEFISQKYPGAINRLEAEDYNRPAVKAYRKNGFEELPYLEMIRFSED